MLFPTLCTQNGVAIIFFHKHWIACFKVGSHIAVDTKARNLDMCQHRRRTLLCDIPTPMKYMKVSCDDYSQCRGKITFLTQNDAEPWPAKPFVAGFPWARPWDVGAAWEPRASSSVWEDGMPHPRYKRAKWGKCHRMWVVCLKSKHKEMMIQNQKR